MLLAFKPLMLRQCTLELYDSFYERSLIYFLYESYSEKLTSLNLKLVLGTYLF